MVAAAIVLGQTAASDASTARLEAQRFTLFSANVRGKDVQVAVEADGPISGIASETQTDKDTPGGQINYVTLRFANGTVKLAAPETFNWKINGRACTAIASGSGTFRITGGTGAYNRAHGKGTLTTHGIAVGARDSKGACLRKAQPTVNYVTTSLVGTAGLG
jgi:hypothetical protein